MHKSAIITRLNLILIGSITMMMIMLFTSINILSNKEVYGQEYDDGYNSYNKYPTKDYKYECQKGPFEGFFVGSVEFCDAKSFDDNKKKKDKSIKEEPQNSPTPPPPTSPGPPTTTLLTVKQQLFGCNNVLLEDSKTYRYGLYGFTK